MQVQLKDFPAAKLPVGSAVESIVCGQPKADGYLFGVFKLQDGLYMAAWEKHCTDPCTMADMLELLNVHEKELLRHAEKKK